MRDRVSENSTEVKKKNVECSKTSIDSYQCFFTFLRKNIEVVLLQL